MTLTRKYYESLIELFASLNRTTSSNPIEYFKVKSEISNLINRIQKFDLIPLTFSDTFFEVLNSKKLEDFTSEKIKLTNEMHYELIECLWTDRLRYSGELIQYASKIKLALLNLEIGELELFEKLKKEPLHYFLPEKFEFKSEIEKKSKINELKKIASEKVNKEKVFIKKASYRELEEKLTLYLSEYRNYIAENYHSIADNFTYCNKMVRAYITEAMPKDSFELRIHSYLSTNGDTSIKLKYEYFDFYPSYFHNLEEITQKSVGAYASILRKDNFYFSNPFSIENIHSELILLFILNSNEKEIQGFSEFLLKCEGYKIIHSEPKVDMHFDIMATKDDTNYAFEIYHHQSRSTEKIKDRINEIKKASSDFIPCFLFTTFPGMEIYNLLREEKVNVFNLQDFTRKQFDLDNSQIVHWYIKSNLSTLNIKTDSSEIQLEGKKLISRLQKCPLGEKNWSEYERIGIDIFAYLFKDNFKKYLCEEQIENDLKNHRRDLLVNNNFSDSTSFWADVKRSYSCSAIIVDFKNYSDRLNSTNFFSVSKYTKRMWEILRLFSLEKELMIQQKMSNANYLKVENY
ncbi:hypothetical protein [Marinifilum flexuosum]|uniref:hypothetical protein n=1 Tax=Marinifilum flexuosum TaxID=1117708 RepID=UPI0024959CE3|nr:hypothetical protein [Marinifilum flexuosum]